MMTNTIKSTNNEIEMIKGATTTTTCAATNMTSIQKTNLISMSNSMERSAAEEQWLLNLRAASVSASAPKLSLVRGPSATPTTHHHLESR